jgi:phage terminase large subunit-like protein
MPDEYYFDDAAAEAAVEFFPRYLRHSKGAYAGQPFKLETWQAQQIIRPFFGWKRRSSGLRRYRTCWLEVPRKNGKSTLCAGVALLGLFGDGEAGAEVYTAATDKDQARLVFSEAKNMVLASPDLRRLCDPFKDSIYVAQTGGALRAISSDAKTKDGLNIWCFIMDEVHAHRDRSLYDVLHTAQGARTQPIEFLATTAGKDRNTFGYEMHEYALKVLKGTVDDPEFLPVIFGSDVEDDWRDETVWKKANPNYGISLQKEYMQAQANRANEMLAYQNVFRQLHLNQWVEQATRAIDMDQWRSCAGDDDWQALEEKLEGRACHAGLDLSTTTDLTALILVFPPPQDDPDDNWYVLSRFFVPEDGLTKRERRDRAPFRQWRDQGALICTDGNIVDYRAIKEQIEADSVKFRIVSVGYDPWNATQLSIELQDEGYNVMEFRQGFGSMAAPTRELMRLVAGGLLSHGGHPVLAWCASNLSVKTDSAGNMKPDKQKSSDRIDGIVGLVMGLGRAIAQGEQSQSNYETRGLLVL